MGHYLWSFTQLPSAGTQAGLEGLRRFHSHVWCSSSYTRFCSLHMTNLGLLTAGLIPGKIDFPHGTWVPKGRVPKIESRSCIALKPALEVTQCHLCQHLLVNTCDVTSPAWGGGEIGSASSYSEWQRLCSWLLHHAYLLHKLLIIIQVQLCLHLGANPA